MKYFVILLFLIIFFLSSDDVFAVCCFPYDMIHYIDPITGSLVVSGELWNDSYKVEPFGNAKYEFVFHNSTGGALFERELVVTDGHPIRDGFVINPLGAHPLPFQMIIDDMDSEILSQVAYVGTGRTHVDYFSWKPTDLNATLSEFKKIETIQGQTHGTLFDKWQVSGTITNTYSEATQNVYVLASLYESEHRLVGVAGYSNDDIQPKTLEGHETKEFKIHALIPQEKYVNQVSLYAESDNSSMKYPNTKPIIIKPDAQIKHGTKGNSIPISVNVTNISRENVDFDWILQIKKSPKSLDEGDITNYPESKVAFIDVVPIDVMAQESKQLEYLWTPITGGIYFYEMYMWDDGLPVSPAFAGSFLYSDQILVTSNSLKEQLTSEISFENLQCINNLVLIQKYDGSPACVKLETKQKLIDRGWTEKDTKDLSNPLLQKWTYDTKGEISSIGISEDDSIIAVGTKIRDTQKGMLYLLDNDGMILWKKEFDSMISHVDISNNTILVKGLHLCGGGGGAMTHCNYTADIFDIQGNKKQSYPNDDNTTFGASLSPNGSQIITFTYDVLTYFKIQENDSWTYNPDESIRHATFLTDSTLLVNTDNTGETIALDNTGDKLWSFITNYPDNYSYATSNNGKYFVVSDYTSPDDGNIYLLDSNGNLLWQANTGNTVLHLEFSGDDSRILVEINGAFMVYDMQGNMLWKNNIPSNLTMSSYGSFLLGTTFNQGSGASIMLFDDKGNILSNHPTDKESLSVVFALANNDEYFVMANDTNQLVMFEVIPDFDKISFELTDLQNSDDLHVKIVPKTPGLFDVAIAKGDYIEIPWDIKFDQGYTRSNFGVSIASDSDIESQIMPTSPYTTINGVPPSKKVIIIHPKPDATTENYTVQILGRGDTVHNQTGWMTNIDGKILGTINVNVIPKPLGLQRVLDSCNATGIQPSIGYRYSNDTHTIANNSCEWKTIEEYENEN